MVIRLLWSLLLKLNIDKVPVNECSLKTSSFIAVLQIGKQSELLGDLVSRQRPRLVTEPEKFAI